MKHTSFYIWKKNSEYALQTSGAVGSGVWQNFAILLRTENGEYMRIEVGEAEDVVSVCKKWKRVSEIKVPKKIKTYEHEVLEI